MVMVRCTGACAAVRCAECARATARSMEVAVASRWAAAMNASASCDVVGALGLAQQGRDPGQHLVVAHDSHATKSIRRQVRVLSRELSTGRVHPQTYDLYLVTKVSSAADQLRRQRTGFPRSWRRCRSGRHAARG